MAKMGPCSKVPDEEGKVGLGYSLDHDGIA